MPVTLSDTSTYDASDRVREAFTPPLVNLTKPPFFALGEVDYSVLPQYTQSTLLNQGERDLVTAIFDLCAMDSERMCDMQGICARLAADATGEAGVGASGIKKRLTRLQAGGFLSKTTINVSKPGHKKGGRPATLYTMQQPSRLLSVTAQPPSGTTVQQLDLFNDAAMLEEVWHRHPSLRMDDFWCQLISSVLPVADRTHKTSLRSTIYYLGEELPIDISSRAGSRIPTIRSIKTVIALFTIVELTIKQAKQRNAPVGKRYVVELGDVLRLMGLKNAGGNRRTVIQHLQEWENAIFKFPSLNKNAQKMLSDRFGEGAFGFSHHQLITQLCGVGVLKEGQKIPTHVGFELPADLVRRIEDEGVYNLFTVTPEFMREDNPLALAFHLYCRKNLGHNRAHPLTPTLRTLHQRICRDVPYADFRRAFSKLIAEKLAAKNSDVEYQAALRELIESDTKVWSQQVSILGYNTTLHGERVSILVDLEDKYVGIASKHAKLEQLAEREVAATAEKAYREKNPTAYQEK